MSTQPHAYKKIYDMLRSEIESGIYAQGERLPTEKELCERHGVSRITSKTALDLLAQHGIAERVRGSGTYVKQPEAARAGEPHPSGNLIGVIMPDFNDAFGTGVLYGIDQMCAERGAYFLLRRSGNDPQGEHSCIEDMLAQGVIGLLVMAQHGEYYNNTILKLIVDHFPIVILDRKYRGVESNYVGTDNLAAAEQLADHLLDEGHRAIALISPHSVNTSTLEDRIAGFVNAYAKRSLHPNRNLWFTDVRSTLPMNSTPETIAQDKAELHAHFEANREITAVFAVEYKIAVLAREVAMERGLSVPGDLTIVCFDTPNASEYHSEFTCIKQRQEEIGRAGAQLLFELAQNPDANKEKRTLQLDAQLIIAD